MKIQHVRKSEIVFFEDYTQQKYTDLPEGSQQISSTLCLVLMRKYMQSRIPWWKRLFIFGLFLSLLSCTCLPQIPTQHLYVDSACTVTLPDYMTIFRVYDNCTDVQVVQYPEPGTILISPDPFSVDLVARDKYGNNTGVTFNIEIIDTIGPYFEYIGDTLHVYHHQVDHSLDSLIQSYVSYRQHLGDTAIQRSFKVYF